MQVPIVLGKEVTAQVGMYEPHPYRGGDSAAGAVGTHVRGGRYLEQPLTGLEHAFTGLLIDAPCPEQDLRDTGDRVAVAEAQCAREGNRRSDSPVRDAASFEELPVDPLRRIEDRFEQCAQRRR